MLLIYFQLPLIHLETALLVSVVAQDQLMRSGCRASTLMSYRGSQLSLMIWRYMRISSFVALSSGRNIFTSFLFFNQNVLFCKLLPFTLHWYVKCNVCRWFPYRHTYMIFLNLADFSAVFSDSFLKILFRNYFYLGIFSPINIRFGEGSSYMWKKFTCIHCPNTWSTFPTFLLEIISVWRRLSKFWLSLLIVY